MYRLIGILTAFTLLLGSAWSPAVAQDKTLTVFAAASMKNALDEVDTAYTAKTGVKISVSYAASSALAKQIEQGAPADVFVSADTDWMDYAIKQEDHQRADPGQSAWQQPRADRAEGFQDRQCEYRPASISPRLAGDGKIATGDVKSVPVGKYAKAALEKLGAWEAAEPKFAMAENVRAALALVARGEAVLGIVYSTDAKVEPGVKIVGTFPADSHPAIIYPVAATTTAKPENSRLSRLPAHVGGQGHLRKIRLQVPGQPDDLKRCSRSRRPNGRRSCSRLRVAIVATLVATPFGIGLAWLLARYDFWGKSVLDAPSICRWCCRRSSPAICCC